MNKQGLCMFFVTRKKYQDMEMALLCEQDRTYRLEKDIKSLLSIIENSNIDTISEKDAKFLDEKYSEYCVSNEEYSKDYQKGKKRLLNKQAKEKISIYGILFICILVVFSIFITISFGDLAGSIAVYGFAFIGYFLNKKYKIF